MVKGNHNGGDFGEGGGVHFLGGVLLGDNGVVIVIKVNKHIGIGIELYIRGVFGGRGAKG